MDIIDRIFISFMFSLTLLFITVEIRHIKDDLEKGIANLVCERPTVIKELRGDK